MKEDENLPLSKTELKQLIPFRNFIEFIRSIKIKLDAHPRNSGYVCILGGKASTYKTTICEILAMAYGPYHVWPGTQFIKEDVFKYDFAARAAISTIVIEECRWLSLHKKITLNDTFCSIKEQLSGAGLHVRLAKNKTSIDDLILKIERFFISFNPDEYIDIQTMNDLINRKLEFKRRFNLYNMDSIELANLYAKSKVPWRDEYKIIASKLLRNSINWERFMDLLEEDQKNLEEINNIIGSIKDFESEEEQEAPPHPLMFQDEEFPTNFQDTREYKFKDIFS